MVYVSSNYHKVPKNLEVFFLKTFLLEICVFEIGPLEKSCPLGHFLNDNYVF